MIDTRRNLLKASIAGFPALRLARGAPSDRLRIACVGVRGRAGHLMRGFARMPEIDIVALCDIDSRLFPKALDEVAAARPGKAPATLADFRRALDDKSIDAVVVGTPDHWHAIPAVMACQAGKHVYVEKPCSHNIREGEAMLAAARRHNRVMQVGIQSRSDRLMADAIAYIRAGKIGKVVFAKAWETARQRPLGHPKDEPVPAGVDYDMWLGPAPRRPFNPLRFHGNWRWFFDYGTGDLGNDGVHRIDYALRGLQAGFAARGEKLPDWPSAVMASGGKHMWDDAQQFPDTLTVVWEYPGSTLMYEMRIWTGSRLEGEEEGAIIYGSDGHVVIGNRGWRAYGPKGEPGPGVKPEDAVDPDPEHKADFLAAIRGGGRPACDIALGHLSSSLCHMGNTAWRVGRKLNWDAAAMRYKEPEANPYLGREYRAPWVLPKVS